ncbi:MAG: hypothetical protein QGH94_01765 [Phycisphaerae bacterium]|nr:hypothetical protein [Phycisphaerae bacterium]MDP7286699.1 hypothetical protein [Phycisphaerae bacterium]
MQNERKRILGMLARSEIGVDEADKLLVSAGPGDAPVRRKPRYLYIIIARPDEDKDRVNLRIPLKLLAYGLKLTRLIPHTVRDKVNSALAQVGMDFTITQDNIVDFLDALTDISVQIDSGEKVQIYCR